MSRCHWFMLLGHLKKSAVTVPAEVPAVVPVEAVVLEEVPAAVLQVALAVVIPLRTTNTTPW